MLLSDQSRRPHAVIKQLRAVSLLKLKLAIVIAVLTGHAGCGEETPTDLPNTYPVTGKVVDKAGKPVTAGSVQFESVVDAEQVAVGKLQPDGAFSLTTAAGETTTSGAAPGEYQVTFLPGTREQSPYRFKGPLRVGADNNHFELKYPY